MSFEINVDHSQYAPVIKLIDNSTGTEAEVFAFGGLLNAFKIPVGGVLVNAVAGFDSVSDAQENISPAFKSAKLSPFVCRMNLGKYSWNDDDLTVQKLFMGKHAIHGILFDAVYAVHNTRSSIDQASVELRYAYPGSDRGYPFPYLVQIKWTLAKGNRLTVETSITNASPAAIPLSDGWHPYFTLGKSVDDCTLEFSSNQQVEFDTELLPTGKIISDERFVKGSLMKNIFLDNCFQLNHHIQQPYCKLSNNQLELLIEPDSSYPFLQIYTPPTRDMIAIENLSSAPDAFNNKMGLLSLEPHAVADFSTTYILKAK
jgi:aldose 1-epimerase